MVLHGTYSLRPLPVLTLGSAVAGVAVQEEKSSPSFTASYDPGPFEWFSLRRALSRGNRLRPLLCFCGREAVREKVISMRGRQVLLLCPVGRLSAEGNVQGQEEEGAGRAEGTTEKKKPQRSCGLSVFGDEAFLQEEVL